jgi:hypothetical protein
VRIGREELRLLRENSANVGRVAESNARLSDELEKCREAVGRVDELEKENKRLAAELQQRLTRQDTVSIPEAQITAKLTPKPTPTPNDPPSSVARIDCNETKPVSVEKYHGLVRKYNRLAEQFRDMKEARQTFEDKFRTEKDKNKEWNTFKEKLDKSSVKKDEKTKRLEAEIRRLKDQLQEKDTGDPDARRPAAQAASNANPPQAANETAQGPSSIEIPASSPIRASALPMVTNDDIGLEENHVDGRLEDVPTNDLEHVDLPQHRGNIRSVEETQFDTLEAHRSSSTEGEADLPPSQEVSEEEDPDLLSRKSPSPETPVVIRSRSIKKRKALHIVTEATLIQNVKIETISSSPIGLTQFLPVNESLDLDDIGEKVDTPRKHRQLHLELSRQASQRLSKNSETNHGQYQRTPVNKINTPSISTARRTDSVLQSRSTNEQILPQTSDGRPPKKRRTALNKDVDTLMEDGEFATPTKGKSGGSEGDGRLIDLLSKPSPPRRALSPAGPHAGNQQSRSSHLRTAISGLAVEITRQPPNVSDNQGNLAKEDMNEGAKDDEPRIKSTITSRPCSKGSATGQINSSKPASKNSSRSSVEPPRPVSRDLKDIPLGLERTSKSPIWNPTRPVTPVAAPLSDPVPLKSVTGLPPRRDPQAIFTPKPLVTKVPVSASAYKPHNGIVSAMKNGQTKLNNMTLEEWEVDPDQEHLRTRPVEKLRLQDFKVNKDYNQGHDYAFREVVRGHARHSLEGCTKPNCCGDKFRKLAEITTVESPTKSQEERDDELLRKFMGDNAHKLRNLSEAERHELLLQAKTRDLSYHLGRHRHAYARQSSPPGFWRTDFPTTQEEMADRIKAEEIERALILERYNEAMRPGGRYIFRDE